MTRLPRVSGKEVIRRLKKLDFEVFDQSGSHVYLHKWDQRQNTWTQRVTVPVHGHKTLKLGTLKSLLKQADVNVEEFSKL